MDDISHATIPLWSAIIASGGILTALGAVVAWCFGTFVTKSEAAEMTERHTALTKQVNSQGDTLNGVARDVSYIRGRMERDT